MTSSAAHQHSLLRFDQLEEAETQRRELAVHGQTARYAQYLYFGGTILPTVLTTMQFWLTLVVFLIVRVLMHHEIVTEKNVYDLDFRWVSAVGGFITFLLVFYNNQIYGRFLAQYESSVKCKSAVQSCATLARDNLPTAMAWQFVRYLNGVHLLGYVGLSDTYEKSNLFTPLNDELQLFTELEMVKLDAIHVDKGSVCMREVLGWALHILRLAYEQKFIDSAIYNLIVGEVFQLRSGMGTLFNLKDQPIPFLYVHLIYFLSLFYLVLFSFFVATSFEYDKDWGNLIALLIVILNNIFTIGLLEIGRYMSDPFGPDLCDLNVIRSVRDALTGSRRILTGSTFELSSLEMETALEQKRPANKGSGYAAGNMTVEQIKFDGKIHKGDSSMNVLHIGI